MERQSNTEAGGFKFLSHSLNPDHDVCAEMIMNHGLVMYEGERRNQGKRQRGLRVLLRALNPKPHES